MWAKDCESACVKETDRQTDRQKEKERAKEWGFDFYTTLTDISESVISSIPWRKKCSQMTWFSIFVFSRPSPVTRGDISLETINDMVMVLNGIHVTKTSIVISYMQWSLPRFCWWFIWEESVSEWLEAKGGKTCWLWTEDKSAMKFLSMALPTFKTEK